MFCKKLVRIGTPELRLIRGTLRRLATISEDRSEPLLTEVAQALRQRLELTEIPYSDLRQFLRELLSMAERYSGE